jgi:predicted SAM-dependent methyltransferase
VISERLQLDRLATPEAKQRIGARLARWPILWRVAALVLRGIAQPRRAGQIRRYLDENQLRKLRIGAGRHRDEGWLSVDLVPLSSTTVFLDATKAFPLPDNSFHLIVSEHMIEHLDLRGGRSMLAECRRVLRPGGVLRIATPDLERIVRCATYQEDADHNWREYVAIMNRFNPNIPANDRDNPTYMLNRVVRDWGHQFIYDEATLSHLLAEEGFCDISRCQPSDSKHLDLLGVERHQEEIGGWLNNFETMVIEASTPL